MAVTQGTKKVTMLVDVVTGAKSDGTNKTSTRTVGNINPALGDEDFYTIGSGLAGLTKFTLGDVHRNDKIQLVNAG